MRLRNYDKTPVLLAAVACLLQALLAPWGHGSVAANGTIHYVDADATSGGNNGSSWADAFTELQPALDAALSGDQIWVAAGSTNRRRNMEAPVTATSPSRC